jgi:hypothetical protein
MIAHIDEGMVVLHERFTLNLDETGKRVEIMIEQLPAQFRRQIRFGVVQERSHVILQRALAASLVVEENGCRHAT